jgi:hypothetical protein
MHLAMINDTTVHYQIEVVNLYPNLSKFPFVSVVTVHKALGFKCFISWSHDSVVKLPQYAICAGDYGYQSKEVRAFSARHGCCWFRG